MKQIVYKNIVVLLLSGIVLTPAYVHAMSAKDRFTGYKSGYEVKLKQAQDFAAVGAAGVTQQQLQNFHKALTEARDALHTIDAEAQRIKASPAIATIRGAPLNITDAYIAQQRAMLDALQVRYNAEYEELKKQGEAAHGATRAAATASQAASQEEMKRLQAAVDATRTQLQGSQDMTAQAQRELDAVRKQLEGRPTPEQLAAAQQALGRVGDELKQAQTSMAQLSQENSRLVTVLKNLETQQKQLEAAREGALHDREADQGKLTQLQASLAQAQQQFAVLQQARAAADAEVQKAKENLAAIQAELNKRPTGADIKKLQDDVAALKQQIAQADTKATTEKAALAQADAKAQEQVRKLQGEAAQAKEQVGKADQARAAAEAEAQRVKAEFTAVQADVKKFQDEFLAVKKQLAQADAKAIAAAKKAEDDVARAQALAAGLQDGYGNLDATIKELTAQQGKLQQARAAAEAEAKQAKTELKAAPSKKLLDNLEQDLQHAREQSAQRQAELAKRPTVEDLKNAQAEAAAARQQLVAAEEKATAAQVETKKQHDTALKKCRDELEALQRNVTSFEASQAAWFMKKNNDIVMDFDDFNKRANRMEPDAKRHVIDTIVKKTQDLEELLAHAFGVVDKAIVDAITTTRTKVAERRKSI